MNNKIYIVIALLMVLFSTGAEAQPVEKDRPVELAYDVDFEFCFDNREFYKSDFSNSSTIFGAQLTPSIGIDVNKGTDLSHRVMLGVDVFKDFGAKTTIPQLFSEVTFYYNMEKVFPKTEISLFAGIFPRSAMEGNYSQAFFSDSLTFYDSNLEGVLLKIKRPKAQFELGCDWMGMIGPGVRERFMIFSAGEGKVLDYLTLGYAAYMYHYANSYEVKGVVDNILCNPYVRLELEEFLPLQKFSLALGYLQSAQRDRKNIGDMIFPGGGEFNVQIQKWGVGVSNSLFVGKDMMPYYNNLDQGGYKYGSDLYFGDPFYRVFDNDTDKLYGKLSDASLSQMSNGSDGSSIAASETGRIGVYNRLEVYYAPEICSFLDLKISAVFHFNGGYSGCQQRLSLCFDLHSLINRNK